MTEISTASFDEWQIATAREDRDAAGPLWRMTAYRKAIYALEEGWSDVISLQRHSLMRPIAAQLYRALGSIAANIAEGYSRSSGKDRVRLLEYALGSTRECLVWYRAAKPLIASEVFSHRIDTLVQIARLLAVTIPIDRDRRVRKA